MESARSWRRCATRWQTAGPPKPEEAAYECERFFARSRVPGVLLVDSAQSIRVLVTTMLEDSGASVTAVGTADEALEALERERPEVLISALAMPDKGGDWLIGKVRGLPPERGGATPAAALTGFTGPEHRASILRAGFQYDIEKPVSSNNLSGIVALLALKTPPTPQD